MLHPKENQLPQSFVIPPAEHVSSRVPSAGNKVLLSLASGTGNEDFLLVGVEFQCGCVCAYVEILMFPIQKVNTAWIMHVAYARETNQLPM